MACMATNGTKKIAHGVTHTTSFNIDHMLHIDNNNNNNTFHTLLTRVENWFQVLKSNDIFITQKYELVANALPLSGLAQNILEQTKNIVIL